MSVLPVHSLAGSLGGTHRRIAFVENTIPKSWWRLKLMAGCYGRLNLMAVSQMMLVAAQTYGRLLWPAQPYGRLPNDVVLAVIVNGMSRGSRKERTPTRKPKKSLPWILQTKNGWEWWAIEIPFPR